LCPLRAVSHFPRPIVCQLRPSHQMSAVISHSARALRYGSDSLLMLTLLFVFDGNHQSGVPQVDEH
jgi:hypothetical protein